MALITIHKNAFNIWHSSLIEIDKIHVIYINNNKKSIPLTCQDKIILMNIDTNLLLSTKQITVTQDLLYNYTKFLTPIMQVFDQ